MAGRVESETVRVLLILALEDLRSKHSQDETVSTSTRSERLRGRLS
jgi:hypothetical protein